MWEKIKANRAFRFVLGLALVVVGVHWLMTGDLLFAVRDTVAPSDGKTSAGADAVLSVVVQSAISLLVAFGGYLIAASEFIFKSIKGAILPQSSTVTPSQPIPAISDLEAQAKELLIQLGDAILANDKAKETQLRWLIRMPKALSEAVDAYVVGDVAAWKKLTAELSSKLEGDLKDAK